MNRRNLLIIGVILILLIILAVFFRVERQVLMPQANNQNTSESVGEEDNSPTREEVPTNISVPEAGQVPVSEEVAIPNIVVPATQGAVAEAPRLRIFKTVISASGFEPSEFIVNQKDTTRIDIESKGGEFIIAQPDYGLSQTVNPTAIKTIQFDANEAGKYLLYCESCGGPENGPKAYVTVVPK